MNKIFRRQNFILLINAVINNSFLHIDKCETIKGNIKFVMFIVYLMGLSMSKVDIKERVFMTIFY